jgi:protein involved in polysaccharide export with SLBB domain
MKKTWKLACILLVSNFILWSASCNVFARGGEYLRSRSGSLAADNENASFAEGKKPSVEYFVAPGDSMEIFLWRGQEATEAAVTTGSEASKSGGKSTLNDYVIVSGDNLEIFVWQNPDLSKDIIVGPDGKISYPLIGRFQAAGLTIEQLEAMMRERLAEYVKYPRVSVMVKDFGGLGSGKNALENPPKEITVGPDGELSYPIIGRFKAAGLTLTQLESKMGEEFSKYVKDTRVSVVMKKFTGNKIIIMGEVTYPGVYSYQGAINLIEAVALAGDFTDAARTDSVIVVHDNMTPNPKVVRVNIFRAVHKGTSKSDVVLMPNDVVYVPKRFIANFNQFLNDIQPSVNAAMQFFTMRSNIVTWYTHTGGGFGSGSGTR